MGPGTDRPQNVPSWLGYLAAKDTDVSRPAIAPEDRLVGILPGRLSGDVEMMDDLIGTPTGGHPEGSPEALEAIRKAFRHNFGMDLDEFRVIGKPKPPARKPAKTRDLRKCIDCGALYERHGRQVRCGPCDGELTMRQSQQRVELWRAQERDSA